MLGAFLFAVSLGAAIPNGTGCAEAVEGLAVDAVIRSADLRPAPCSGKPEAPYRYDARLRATRALRDIRPGEILAALPSASLVTVRPGDHLSLQTKAGPVMVRREVEALQSARPGQRLFVRTSDGAVFSVMFGGTR